MYGFKARRVELAFRPKLIVEMTMPQNSRAARRTMLCSALSGFCGNMEGCARRVRSLAARGVKLRIMG